MKRDSLWGEVIRTEVPVIIMDIDEVFGCWTTGKKGEDQAEGQEDITDIGAGEGEKMDTA
jgi:hypothetical protein